MERWEPKGFIVNAWKTIKIGMSFPSSKQGPCPALLFRNSRGKIPSGWFSGKERKSPDRKIITAVYNRVENRNMPLCLLPIWV